MRIAFGMLVLCLFVPVGNAAEVRLKDGSVVVGTVLSLADGEDLLIDTEHMDEVTIDWDAIVTISGTQIVEVELFNGRRILGSVNLEEGGVSIAGINTLTVDSDDVFAIGEVNDSFQEALEVHTDLGMNIVRGNNRVTQISFGGGIDYDGTDFETSLSVTTIINEQTESVDTRRLTLNGSYTYKFGGGWQGTGLYQFESDEQQNLDGRSLFGGAIAKRIVNQRRHRVELYGGLGVNSENFSDQERNESLEAIIGASYRMRWGADFDLGFTLFPNLQESSRIRTQLDASLSFDLFSDFDFKVTVYDRYDSQPPPGNENNDSGLTLGLSWDY
ncbi:MAG: DUF481 domain-containing protein [Pseudomonadota bacterium]